MSRDARSILGLLVLVGAVSIGTQWWGAHSKAKIGEQLAAVARPGDIRMLSSRTCVYCSAARRWMQEHGVAFSECFIETDKECAAQFEAARAAGTPLLLVRGQAQLGFDAQRVLYTLQRVPAG